MNFPKSANSFCNSKGMNIKPNFNRLVYFLKLKNNKIIETVLYTVV